MTCVLEMLLACAREFPCIRDRIAADRYIGREIDRNVPVTTDRSPVGIRVNLDAMLPFHLAPLTRLLLELTKLALLRG
jgi:hypothetical protein